MPKYYFHTHGAEPMIDCDGVELADITAARYMAIRTAGEMMRDGEDVFWDTKPWLVTVTDEAGSMLIEIEMHGHAALEDPTVI